jgi:type IV pilus assembly protein PilE
MNTRHNVRGFTLIEVMVVVSIVAILAAIAYPSYQENVRRGRRADAQSVLLQAAQWMERYYSQNNRYSDAKDSSKNDVFKEKSGLTTTGSGGVAYYNITLSSVGSDDNSYTLTATRVADSAQADDPCGNFAITNTGVKTVSGGSRSTADCWRR